MKRAVPEAGLADQSRVGAVHFAWDHQVTGEFAKRVREMSSQLFVCRGIDRLCK